MLHLMKSIENTACYEHKRCKNNVRYKTSTLNRTRMKWVFIFNGILSFDCTLLIFWDLSNGSVESASYLFLLGLLRIERISDNFFTFWIFLGKDTLWDKKCMFHISCLLQFYRKIISLIQTMMSSIWHICFHCTPWNRERYFIVQQWEFNLCNFIKNTNAR